MEMPQPFIAAVVVTYNRRDILRRTLNALQGQSRSPDVIFVVDNDSADDTDQMVASDYPGVEYLRLPDNLGFAAGLAAGMERAVEQGADLVWLMDDDSVPRPDCLEQLVGAVATVDKCGIVGLSGGLLRHGVPDRRSTVPPFDVPGTERLRRADFVLVDGALVSRQAIGVAGLPRGDFFMMMEDVEYTSRLQRHGFEVVLLDEDLIDRGHLGSGANTGSAPPWRGYYQSRNHLVVALERRSPTEVLGWFVRQLKYIGRAILSGDRKWRRVSYRLLGAVHAVTGRMGRTIQPGA